MALHYAFKVDKDMLTVTTEGKDESLDERFQYSRAVIEQALKHNSKKILCDERNLEYAISIPDTYELAEKISYAVTRVARVAIVCNKEYQEEGKFFETVASNRGLVISVTPSYDLAREWLNEK